MAKSFMIYMEMSGNGGWIDMWAHCLEEITRCTQAPRLTALFVAVVGAAMRSTCAPLIASAATRSTGTAASGSAL